MRECFLEDVVVGNFGDLEGGDLPADGDGVFFGEIDCARSVESGYTGSHDLQPGRWELSGKAIVPCHV